MLTRLQYGVANRLMVHSVNFLLMRLLQIFFVWMVNLILREMLLLFIIQFYHSSKIIWISYLKSLLNFFTSSIVAKNKQQQERDFRTYTYSIYKFFFFFPFPTEHYITVLHVLVNIEIVIWTLKNVVQLWFSYNHQQIYFGNT